MAGPMTTVDNQFDDLRNLVRKLDPTGPDGFEGLMAAVLTDITKTSFGLANSGSQRGKDGQSVLNDGAISFEGKLYDETVPKNEIFTKIAEIAADDDGAADLWILGSTGTVATQVVNTANALGKKFSVAILIADWSTVGLPTLATILAMAPAVTAKFIAGKTGASEQNILDKLNEVRQDPQFADRTLELNRVFEQPSLGPAYALKENQKWLQAAFGSAKRARAVFGQPLAPGDTLVTAVLDRADLRQRFSNAIYGKPDDAIAAVLGADGNGKSWLFAQAWMHQPIKPLTVVLVPDDIKAPFSFASLEELLISKLILQTSDAGTETSEKRWKKHLDRWKRLKGPDRSRLVVFLDGINQRESIPWVKLIDSLSEVLADLGGKLVFSCRDFFYRDNLRNRLLSRVVLFDVPEWSTTELETLLVARGTSISKLNASVVGSLRNPRIFAVAAELLKNSQIEQFDELSVSRLLFEHIRTGASLASDPLPPHQFVRDMCDHADVIVERLKQTQTADLTVFDRPRGIATSQSNHSLADQFVLTSAGRFFEPLSDDPTRYTLKEDGLPLALGLSLVSTAKRAWRNRLNIEDELSKILDPIAALDKTTDVLISALLAAVLEDDTPDEVVAPLVKAFIGLQNLDAGRYREFRALARRAPSPFLRALENSALADSVSSNLSWLTEALLEGRRDGTCSQVIATYVRRWLSMYSPAPERLMMTPKPGASQEERATERKKRKDKLNAELAAFSAPEAELLKSLVLEERGDYSRLNKIAFRFLAGTHLTPFAESLRNWCFAASFNGGFTNPHEEFDDLVQFNRLDWADARTAILKAAEILRGEAISRTGQWALVYILRATGASPDAKQAEELVEILTKDREKHGGWRLVENYCATDPCDPNSLRPDNIATTAKAYSAINVTQLKKNLGQGQEDHFFDMARAGLARFEPDAAIETMRRLAADALTRNNVEFRFAVFLLENHTAALDDATAVRFVERASRVAADAIAQGDKHHELWVAAQYGLLIAFPHMTGNDQLDALLTHPKNDNILVELADLMQAIDPHKYEVELEKAYRDADEVNQFRLLMFAEHTLTLISESSKAIVGQLTTSANKFVRLSALGLVCRLKDRTLLNTVVASGWTTAKLDNASDRFEIWYGSEALILAAEQGLLSVEACLKRISLSSYLSLIQKLGQGSVLAVAGRVDSAIIKAAGHHVSANLPDIEERVGRRQQPCVLHVKDKPNEQENSADAFKRLAETGDAWYERHQRNREAVQNFERELTQAGADLIVQSVTPDLVSEIAKGDPSIVRAWYTRFIGIEANALNRVHNIASLVAQIISKDDPQSAIALFEKLKTSSPYVRVTFGRAGVSLDTVSVWGASDCEELKKLKFKRLDQARTDHEISVEVLAAIRAGKQETLREYVIDRRSRPEPSHVARAVTVAGLSEESDWALETIESLKGSYGFLSEAYTGAKYAMDRHRWARYWAKLMGDAKTETDLWRYGVLLAAIVDGRFRGSDVTGTINSSLIKRYGTSFNDLLRTRIESWNNKRGKSLFGMKAPDEVFLD
jgi:hypothetical protein